MIFSSVIITSPPFRFHLYTTVLAVNTTSNLKLFLKTELEYSLIVLELCIQDKAQADDERRNNNERHCLFAPESCDKCRYQRYTDDKRTCADGSPILRYIFFLDLSSVVGMYCADISHYVHDSNDRDAHA